MFSNTQAAGCPERVRKLPSYEDRFTSRNIDAIPGSADGSNGSG